MWTVHNFFDLITEDLNGYSIVRVGISQAKDSQYIAQTKKTKKFGRTVAQEENTQTFETSIQCALVLCVLMFTRG
jgi:hypothetical protein